MAWTEDPTVFLADFGLSVSWNGTSGLGILNMPGEYIADDRVISNEYMLQAETSKFGNISYGDNVLINGVNYEARETPRMLDDGVFCLVLLTLSEITEITEITTLSGITITTLAGDPLITL